MGKLLKSSGSILKHDHVFTGYGGDIPYLKYKDGKGVIDGCGRQHIDLYGRCDICDKEIKIARIHVDSDGKLYQSKSEPKNNQQ